MSLRERITGQKIEETQEAVEKESKSIKGSEGVKAPSSKEKKGDYAKKIDKLYSQMSNGDVICEVYEDGFNLHDDNNGYNTKVHLNFSKLDTNKKQKVFIPHYLDFTNFLELRNLLTSGQASLKAAEMKEKGVDKEVFKEYKNPDGTDIIKTLTLKPAKKDDTWFLTATSSSKKEKTYDMVSISVSTGRLIALLELVYLAYLKHLIKKED